MAMRGIVTAEDEILTKKCRKVDKFDKRLFNLIDDMIETMQSANGVGLAAPQVGILRRVCVVDTGNKVLELVNPQIVSVSGKQVGTEGCLSVPGKYGIVTRPNIVKIKAQNRNGEWYEYEGEGLIARAFCHETDHLEGLLFTHIAERMLTLEELEKLEREEEEK